MDFEFSTGLYYNYTSFKERSFSVKRIKHSDISPLINNLNKHIFNVKILGHSYTGKEIRLISAGKGEKKIFMWSQMHGDESTATMAMFDIFNFLSAKDGYNFIRNKFFENTTLYFLPMVNPDGAEAWKRGNYLDIDINRDAFRIQTPEGKILKETFNDIKADFGFNLHDQNPRYSVGNSHKNAAISFLAPPYNKNRFVNITRSNAINLISGLTRILNKFIPGHIAKYSDEFEYRAFGDTFQGLGTSTILIESGGWKDDPEKQFLRKLNFILLLSAINSIIDSDFQEETADIYDKLPFNEEFLYDMILRNLNFIVKNRKCHLDIAVNRNEDTTNTSGKTKFIASVENIGDLSVFYGLDEINLEGFEIESPDGTIGLGKQADLLIKKNGKVKYKVKNGVLTPPLL
jgi:hypothetical protein